MKKLPFLLVLLMTASLSQNKLASAEEAEKATDHPARSVINEKDDAPSKSCDFHKKFRISKEQHEKIKDAFFKFKENKIHLEASIKLARLNYEKVMAEPNSDEKAAKAAAQEVADSISKMAVAKLAFKNQISFQILTPEQRTMGPHRPLHFERNEKLRKPLGHPHDASFKGEGPSDFSTSRDESDEFNDEGGSSFLALDK